MIVLPVNRIMHPLATLVWFVLGMAVSDPTPLRLPFVPVSLIHPSPLALQGIHTHILAIINPESYPAYKEKRRETPLTISLTTYSTPSPRNKGRLYES
jgi:hypothetical protein